jgi:hypothetical protein
MKLFSERLYFLIHDSNRGQDLFTYVERLNKYWSDSFPVQNGLKQGDALSPLLFNFALSVPLGRSRETRWDGN